MNIPTRQSRGACPGVWRPMLAGDGWIMRVRPRHGRLPAQRLRDLAALSSALGNGMIDVTRRANLQIRGIALESLDAARSRLREIELADTPERERQPGLLVCPLSSLDVRCPALESLADEIEAVLAKVSGSSHKAGVVLSTGSSWCADVAADVHVRVDPSEAGRVELWIGGTLASARGLGACDVMDAAEAVGRIFGVLERAERSSVRALADEHGVSPFMERIKDLLRGPARVADAWTVPGLGFHGAALGWIGCSVPFGSAPANVWEVIAELAERHGDGVVRISPARHVLLPGVAAPDANEVMAELEGRGLGVYPREPELELVACSGAPACLSAHGESRRIASELAHLVRPRLGRRAVLHVSGCEKGCARSAAADVTVVLRSKGCSIGFDVDVKAACAAPAVPVEAAGPLLSARWALHTESSRGPVLEMTA